MLHELKGGGWNSVSQREVWSKKEAETRSHPWSVDLSAKFGFHSDCNGKPLKDLRQVAIRCGLHFKRTNKHEESGGRDHL